MEGWSFFRPNPVNQSQVRFIGFLKILNFHCKSNFQVEPWFCTIIFIWGQESCWVTSYSIGCSIYAPKMVFHLFRFWGIYWVLNNNTDLIQLLWPNLSIAEKLKSCKGSCSLFRRLQIFWSVSDQWLKCCLSLTLPRACIFPSVKLQLQSDEVK